MSDDARQDILKGTLDMLILSTLELESMHGWGIGERIQARSKDQLRVPTGSLYPALQRLQRQGFVAAEWRRTEHNRRARYYRLTRSGRKRLAAERASWSRTALAIHHVLTATG